MSRVSRVSRPELDPEDFTFEGGLMVFTRTYHLKRGFCCENGCRHCPWDFGRACERRRRREVPGLDADSSDDRTEPRDAEPGDA